MPPTLLGLHFSRRFGGGTEAWYSGTPTAPEIPALFPVAIGSHPYMIEPTKYQRRTLPSVRPAVDAQPEPGEVSLSTAGFWRRSASDWSEGAGQIVFDEATSQRARYFTSKGVNPHPDQPVNRYTLRLLADTRLIAASGRAGMQLCSVGGYLYRSDGTELYFCADPSAATPVWVNTGMATASGLATIASLDTDGAFVYAAVGANGLFKTALGTTVSTNALYAAHPAGAVVYGNGRLVVLNGRAINEIDAAGHFNGEGTVPVTGLLAYSHPNPAMVFSSGCPSPHGLMVAGNAGDLAEVWRLAVDAQSGALAAPASLMSLPPGETLTDVVYYGGGVVLATSRGIRVAAVVINFTALALTYGPVTLIPGGVAAVCGQGEFVWFSWSNYDPASTGLGRLNLANFAVPLSPAYSSDLMAGTPAAPLQGKVAAAASHGGRRYFAVDGSGVWAEHPTNLVPSASLSTGRIRFGTTEAKIVSSLELYTDPLPAGASVTPSVLDETNTLTLTRAMAATSQVHSGMLAVPTINPVEQLSVGLTLARGTDPTTGPVLRRWTLRALVVPSSNDEIIAPLAFYDTVQVPVGEGLDRNFDPLAEYLYLRGLQTSGEIVRYQEGDASWDVYIDQIELQPTRLSANHHRFFEGLCLVRMVTVNPS